MFIGGEALQISLLSNQIMNPAGKTAELATPPLPQRAPDILLSRKIEEKPSWPRRGEKVDTSPFLCNGLSL